MSISNLRDASTPPIAAERSGGVMRVVYLLLAGVTLSLGVLGIVLPGLPTTPFILLTSWFLSKSSPRLRRRLLESRLFGSILQDWQQHRGIRRGVKYRAVALVVLLVAATCWFSNFSPVLLTVVVSAACVGVGVIVALPVVETGERRDEVDDTEPPA